jgi:ATP-dependent Lon protease
MELDGLDSKMLSAFDGYVVRKDLVRTFSKQYPVPTYVVEFLLGRYCATADEQEIQEGLEIVSKQLSSRAVRAGEEELFKMRAKEAGSVKLIDIISARLDSKTDSYVATLPSLRLNDVRIDSDLVTENERMLTGGFYAEITLNYDAAIALEKNSRPFGIESLRPIQVSQRDCLDVLAAKRKEFSTMEWKSFLLRSIGIESSEMDEKAQAALFLRMIPFVERNYNLIELGPRGTGKSHLFQQVSPYAHLVSGGKATVAKMFVDNGTGRRGLVCQYDVVCFDEVSGISFDQKDGVNIMKGYMESGQFSRGKDLITAEGSVVMVGNFDVDVQHQQRIGHLFGPLPQEMRNDTAFMDRIHCFLPGWNVPAVKKHHFTNHFGLVSDFLAECFSRMRNLNRTQILQGHVLYGGALSGRDTNAVNKTINGLIKLLFPDPSMPIPDEDLEWMVRLALESRRRVKEQQKRIGTTEFRNTHFSYTIGDDGVEKFVSTPELYSENSVQSEPMEPGQVWAISPGSIEENPGLFKIEINETIGTGVKILNKPTPAPFKECVSFAESNLLAKSNQILGDINLKEHEFSIQLRSFDVSSSGSHIGVGVLIGICSSVLKKPVKGGMIVIGNINLGGSIDLIHNPVSLAELAVEKGATHILIPVSSRRQLIDLSDDIATKLSVIYYQDIKDVLLKALVE